MITDTDRAIIAVKKALELTQEAKIKDGYVGLVGSFNTAIDNLTSTLNTLERLNVSVREITDHIEPPRQLAFNFDC